MLGMFSNVFENVFTILLLIILNFVYLSFYTNQPCLLKLLDKLFFGLLLFLVVLLSHKLLDKFHME